MHRPALALGALALVLCWSAAALAGNGLVNVASRHDVQNTADRLESVLKQKHMTVFARIDHAAGAAGVGKTLRPTQLIIFGNPKVGSPLMLCRQQAGIDLPQKALIWEDAAGKVWLSYNDPAYLSGRHGLSQCAPVIEKITKALAKFAQAATGP